MPLAGCAPVRPSPPRDRRMTVPASGADAYAPLVALLAALPNTQVELFLSFAQLEALLGHPLSLAARSDWFWGEGITARRAWLRRGFRAALTFREQRYGVTFTREFIPGA